MSDHSTEAEAQTFKDNTEVDAVECTSSAEAIGSIVKLPQKRFFRQRAHANPFSDHLLE